MQNKISKWMMMAGVVGCVAFAPSVQAQIPVGSLAEYPPLIMLVDQGKRAIAVYEGLVQSYVEMNNTLGGARQMVSPILQSVETVAGTHRDMLSQYSRTVGNLDLANMMPQTASAAMKGTLITDKLKQYTDGELQKIRETRVAAAGDLATRSMAYAMGNESAIKVNLQPTDKTASDLASAEDLQALFKNVTAVDRKTLSHGLQELSVEATSASVKAMRALDGIEKSSSSGKI